MSRTDKDKPYLLRLIDDGVPVSNRTQVEYLGTKGDSLVARFNVYPHGELKYGREAKEYVLKEFKNQTYDVYGHRGSHYFYYHCSCALCSGNTVEEKRAARHKLSEDDKQQVKMANTVIGHGAGYDYDDFESYECDPDGVTVFGWCDESVSFLSYDAWEENAEGLSEFYDGIYSTETEPEKYFRQCDEYCTACC